MFKKSNRLTRGEFTEYFKTGKRNQFQHLTVITTDSDKTKVSVVVSKKVAKSAVRRNLLKRRVYATLRKLSDMGKVSGVMIVVLKPAFNTLPRKTAEEIMVKSIEEVSKNS